MSRIDPIPGAAIIAFDHGAAAAAIDRVEHLAERVRILRRAETRHASDARTNWRGSSHRRFEARRSHIVAELDRTALALTALADRLRAERARANLLQQNANATEELARRRDLERLAELAAGR